MVSKYPVTGGVFCSYDEYPIQFRLSHTLHSPHLVLYFPLVSHVLTFSDDILSDLQESFAVWQAANNDGVRSYDRSNYEAS